MSGQQVRTEPLSSTDGIQVGVDIGGTFTDLVFLMPDGMLHKLKLPSTPSAFSQAIVTGIGRFCAAQRLEPRQIAEVIHATTVATNAILERKGARTALVTTEGFRDVLELRRIRIPMSYDLGWQKPLPLVRRRTGSSCSSGSPGKARSCTRPSQPHWINWRQRSRRGTMNPSRSASCTPIEMAATSDWRLRRSGGLCRGSTCRCPMRSCRKCSSSSAAARPSSMPMSHR